MAVDIILKKFHLFLFFFTSNRLLENVCVEGAYAEQVFVASYLLLNVHFGHNRLVPYWFF
jgi:hypothetical protein